MKAHARLEATGSSANASAIRSAPSPVTPSNLPPSGEAPALWNPKGVGIAGFFLTWGFCAWLLRQNWKALSDPARAKRATYWFWGLVAWLGICLFVKQAGILYIPIFLAWLYLEVRPQVTHVRATVGDRYVHRAWGKPIGIGSVVLW